MIIIQNPPVPRADIIAEIIPQHAVHCQCGARLLKHKECYETYYIKETEEINEPDLLYTCLHCATLVLKRASGVEYYHAAST